MIGVIGLILGIAALIYGAYKGLGAIPLTLAAGIIVVLTNGMNVWEAYSVSYMSGFTSFMQSYFLIFAASALYAKLMEDSGAAFAIGYKFIDWFGAKRAMLVCFIATSVLTYGGVSLFVVVFAMAPIMMLLFKEADIPKKLTIAPLVAGSATLTMTSLPGTPQLTNVIPANYFGTGLLGGAGFGIAASVMFVILIVWYMNHEEKKERKAGNHFAFGPNDDPSKYEFDKSTLPSAGKSFFPMIVLIVIIVGGSKLFPTINSSMLVVIAMLVGALLTLLIFWNRYPSKMEVFNNGLAGAVSAAVGPCCVVGFGTLVQASPAFQIIVDWVLSQDMNPYITGVFATAVISGITGSSSGGLNITLNTIGEQLAASGANLGTMHRLMAIAAGSLDSLPHSSGLFLMFGYLGVTQKEGYKYAGVISVIFPIIIVVILTAVAIALGL